MFANYAKMYYINVKLAITMKFALNAFLIISLINYYEFVLMYAHYIILEILIPELAKNAIKLQ